MRVPLTEVSFGEAEIAEAVAVLRSGRVTMGARCRAFEAAFAERLGARHAVFVNSGSSANLLAWFALANPLAGGRLKPGDEVIVPAVAWSTTIWPIVQAGGVPVLVDCDSERLTIDPGAVARAVGPRTVAVCPVHPLGNVCDMDALGAVCGRHGLVLVEDTCESLGSRFRGTPAGRFGLMGTFSFYFSHHITTIEGGMVVTDDDALADVLRCLRSHGWSRERAGMPAALPFAERFRFVTTGFNLRPTEINAAFGLHQLDRLDGFNRARVRAADRLRVALAPAIAAGGIRPMAVADGVEAAWFGFPMLCRDGEARDRLADRLEGAGIETRPIICGNMARQPAMAHVPHRIAGPLTGADAVMDRGLYVGIHPLLDDAAIDHVAATIGGFFAP